MTQLASLGSRVELPKLLNDLHLEGLGVEVGVSDGWFSNQILLHSGLRILFSVDPYSQSEEKECNLASLEEYKQARVTLNEHWHRSCILKMTSEEAAHLFLHQVFDFIYIDANHEHASVLQDLHLWWPLLKDGGIFAGHDYCNYHSSVKKAVDEFFIDNNLTLYTTELDQFYEGCPIRSWYTQKQPYATT